MKKPFAIEGEHGPLYHCVHCDEYLNSEKFYESALEEKRHRCKNCSKTIVRDYRNKKNLDIEKSKCIQKKKRPKSKSCICRKCGEDDVKKFFKSSIKNENFICKKCINDSMTKYGKMFRYLKKSSPKPKTLMTEKDIQYLFEKIWKRKSVISGKQGDTKTLSFVHFNINDEMTAWNVILVDKQWGTFFKESGFLESLIPNDSKEKIKKILEEVKNHYKQNEPWAVTK